MAVTGFKKLIDVVPGDRIIGIGLVEQTSTNRQDMTTLVVRDLAVPMPAQATAEALRTYIWKASQLVDIGETDGSGD